jgi:hypothetical protein
MKLPSYCLAALFCLPFAAQAGMVKCKLPNGSSTFQDTPCAKEADASAAHVSGMQYVGGSEPDRGTGSSSAGGASGARTTNVNVYVNQTTNVQVNSYHRGPERLYAERVRLVDTKSAPSNSNTTRASTATATSSGTSRTSTASHAAAGHR